MAATRKLRAIDPAHREGIYIFFSPAKKGE
jgi:hypothetical protein